MVDKPKMNTKRTTRSVRESDTSIESLSHLIESVMDKSEVVLAAQAITDELQGMAEKLAMIQAKDIMTMYDSVTTAFGQQVADQFNSAASEQVTQLISGIQGAKSAIEQEIARMKQGIEGGDMSDMAMDPTPAPGGESEMDAGMDAEPSQGGGGLPEQPPSPGGDMAGNAEDDAVSMGGGFAGRERKESAQPRGRTLEGKTWKDNEDAASKSGSDKDKFKARQFKKKQTEVDEGKTWKDNEDAASKSGSDKSKDAGRKFKSKQAEIEEGKTWKDSEHANAKRDADKETARKLKKKQTEIEEGKTWKDNEDSASKSGSDKDKFKARQFKSKQQVEEDFLGAEGGVAAPVAPQPAIDRHPHKSADFEANLHNLMGWHGKAGQLARNIEAMIDSEQLDGAERKSMANILSHFAAFSQEPSHWSDAEAKLTMALQSTGIWDVSKTSPAVAKIVAQLRKLAHFLVMKHEGLVEKRIKMLGEASNPDAVILHLFRKRLAEGWDAQTSAIKTARMFAIDIEDVVNVVREAKKMVKEAELMQNATMFPVQAGANPAPNPGISNPAGATGPQPSTPPVGGPNQNNSTRRPMSPADKRMQQQQQTSASQGATAQNGQQPPAGGSTMVPPGETEAGGQTPPSTQAKMAPVQQVNKPANQQQPGVPGGKIIRTMNR